MGVTIRQIAEAAGVSRGTVDRALNNRGRIRPEVAERIRAIADEMGYKPNQLGRALSMSRNNIKIGVILQGAETPFMKEVLKGIQEACAEVDNLGGTVLVHKIEHQNAEDVILAMEKMRMEEVSGIAMVPLDEERVKREIDRFVEEFRIPVVTFTSDVEDTKRLCFVGQNGVQCGRAAAGKRPLSAGGGLYLRRADAGHGLPCGSRRRTACPADPHGIRHSEAADAESRSGAGKIRPVGSYQCGHAGLYGKLAENPCQQSAGQAAGRVGPGLCGGGLGDRLPAGGGILTIS